MNVNFSGLPARGVRFERLLVMGPAGSSKGRRLWRCRCDCGVVKVVSTRLLTTGTTRSCGCLHSEIVRELIAVNRRAA